MPKVSVFISWSGNSRPIAQALYEWLPTALHSIDPWMSDQDIHRGTRFLEEIDRALTKCQAGLVCITPENCKSVWVAFEAGALASRVASSKLVIPVVSRMKLSDVPGPLSMFQAGMLTKSDMLAVIKNLNDLNGDDDKIPEKRLEATFAGVWPDLARQLPGLETAAEAAGDQTDVMTGKTPAQLLEEILDVSKATRIMVEDSLRNRPEPVLEPVLERQSYSPIGSGAALQGREGYTALAGHLMKASEIWLAGVSLLTVLDQYFSVFHEYVERDRLSLRFLLLDPEDEILIKTASRSLYSISAPADLKRDIAKAVVQIAELRQAAQDAGRVQLRYMANLPSTSIIMAEPVSGSGIAIAEFYPYRASATDRPHIALSEVDQTERKWFLFYRDQFLTMWRDARTEPGDDG